METLYKEYRLCILDILGMRFYKRVQGYPTRLREQDDENQFYEYYDNGSKEPYCVVETATGKKISCSGSDFPHAWLRAVETLERDGHGARISD